MRRTTLLHRIVTLVKVLRDGLNAEPGQTAAELGDTSRPFAGIGYTVLAWSRDGEIFIYHGGYRRGHKVARFEERQIGLARLRRDRSVAYAAAGSPKKLRTRHGILDAAVAGLTVNARVEG
jgi:hypothetical protein